MWSADQFRELVAPRVRSTWAPRARARPGAAVVVVVNFGAAHAVDGACDGTLLALARSVVAELAAGLAGVRVRFVFASLTCALGLRRANFRTGKSLETLSIARRLARELPDNATGEALDLTNVTAARYDATLDGLHYYGTATSMQALILANMLAPRPRSRQHELAAPKQAQFCC